MELSQINPTLNRITYKPGVKFEIKFFPGDGNYKLIITRNVIDAETPKSKSKENFESLYPISPEILEVLDEKTLIMLVYAAVKRMELHETREWFKVDGQPLEEAHVGDNKPVQREDNRNFQVEPFPVFPKNKPRRPYRNDTIIDRKCKI